MEIKISYSAAALHDAANFIWINNPYVVYWSSKPTSSIDVMADMKKMMIKHAELNARLVHKEILNGGVLAKDADLYDTWNSYTGTGGYYFIFSLIDSNQSEIIIGVDILVDPAIKHKDKGFITEVVDT